jgi:hypothetical protein
MDGGVPLTPSFTVTSPMTFTHFMGMNLFAFHIGMQNYDTHSMPWVFNHFPIDMSNMPSPFPSSPFHAYMNPSFGSGVTMTPLSISSFDRIHVPQLNLTVGGWNLPSYGSNPSHVFSGTSAQMGVYSTYYTLTTYPSSAMSVPTNVFPMADLCLSSGVSSEGSYCYSMGNPLHEVPSSGGNIYPHMTNPCHVAFSSQAASSMSIPLHPFMNQYGGGYYPTRQGHGVYQNPSWPAISQNQSFSEPWSQMPQPTIAQVQSL